MFMLAQVVDGLDVQGEGALPVGVVGAHVALELHTGTGLNCFGLMCEFGFVNTNQLF